MAMGVVEGMFGPARQAAGPEMFPALLLNADCNPVGLYPLKTLGWQDGLRGVMAGRMDVLEEHGFQVRSAGGREWVLPAVLMLRRYQRMDRPVAFTRIGVYVRDRFTCAYCGRRFGMRDLTFDHVVPSSRGGKTNWTNIVTACHACNLRKGDKTPERSGMPLRFKPYVPNRARLNDVAREFPPPLRRLHRAWLPYLGLDPDTPAETATEMAARCREPTAFPRDMTDDEYWNAELDQD